MTKSYLTHRGPQIIRSKNGGLSEAASTSFMVEADRSTIRARVKSNTSSSAVMLLGKTERGSIRMINTESQRTAQTQATTDMQWIPGGAFRMGSEDFYAEESPVHEVTVDGFWMDRCTITNKLFSRFVEE